MNAIIRKRCCVQVARLSPTIVFVFGGPGSQKGKYIDCLGDLYGLRCITICKILEEELDTVQVGGCIVTIIRWQIHTRWHVAKNKMYCILTVLEACHMLTLCTLPSCLHSSTADKSKLVISSSLCLTPTHSCTAYFLHRVITILLPDSVLPDDFRHWPLEPKNISPL